MLWRSILSNSTVYGSQSPTLVLPLQLLGGEALIVNSLRGLSRFHTSVADFQYPLHSAPRLPHIYRAVEGGTKAVLRAPAPLVQQIVRGKTRTMLDTNFAPLQGEWLEAMDVEEYLEERGICATPSRMAQHLQTTPCISHLPQTASRAYLYCWKN
ncbi:hypothetical protein FOXYSP1_16885 [Fusarium oxysporum f. sp. phaseoli]